MHGIGWDEAWEITTATFSYTNHTLLPEALESWPVPLMERLLPRQMQIIYLINALHLDRLQRSRSADDGAALGDVADRRGPWPPCAHGAPRLHRLAQDQRRLGAAHRPGEAAPCSTTSTALYPGRIVNKTNGITFRRWLFEANPGLTSCWSIPSARARHGRSRRAQRISPSSPTTAPSRNASPRSGRRRSRSSRA